jgi:hypothetical protein
LIKLTDGHYEVIELGTSERPDATFSNYLSKIFRDAHTKYTTLSYEATVKTTRTLISDIQFGENIPQIELYLRSAWVKGREDELLHYDLTNPLWQRVEISKDTGTWRIVESYEVARAYDVRREEEEGAPLLSHQQFIIANKPPLFKRYLQTPQVIPSRDYDPNILDDFFETFTNITGKYSKESVRLESENTFVENVKMNAYRKKLLAKVGLVIMYIPDIPRTIQSITGPEGAAKTQYGYYEKSLVDPSATMLETYMPNADGLEHTTHTE